MLWNIAVNDAGAAYDPLTLLRTRTMFGRPDWKHIYQQMRTAIEAGQYMPGTKSQLKTNVGVCYVVFCCDASMNSVYPRRRTSVAPRRLRALSRTPVWPTTPRMSTSASTRSVDVCLWCSRTASRLHLGTLLIFHCARDRGRGRDAGLSYRER